MKGTSRFDRQWQQLAKVPVEKLKWSWVGLTLESGEALSTWSGRTLSGFGCVELVGNWQ